MAIDSSSLTLAQWANQANDPLATAVTFSLLDTGSVLEDIPFQTYKSMKFNGTRFTGNLATVNYRKLNESSVVTSSTATPYQENAYIMSNMIDIDQKLREDINSIDDPSAIQLMAYLRAASYDLNDKFINNNQVTGDADAPIGIRYRLDNPSTMGTNSACKVDCGAVDLTPGSMTAATAATFIEKVEQVLHEVDGGVNGDGVVLYMNRLLARRFGRAVRMLGAGGGFDMTTDAFGRRVTTFRNAVIREVGLKADQSTEIITNTETSAGADGASTYTSFYAVKYGEGYARGWQFDTLANSIQFIGQRSDEPTHERTLIDWAFGFRFQHTRSMGRGYGVKVA